MHSTISNVLSQGKIGSFKGPFLSNIVPTVTISSETLGNVPVPANRGTETNPVPCSTLLKCKPAATTPDQIHWALVGPIQGTMPIEWAMAGGPFVGLPLPFALAEERIKWAPSQLQNTPSIIYGEIADLFATQSAHNRVIVNQIGSGRNDLSGTVTQAVLTTELRNYNLNQGSLQQNVTNMAHFRQSAIDKGPFSSVSSGTMNPGYLLPIASSFQDIGNCWVFPVNAQFLMAGTTTNKVSNSTVTRCLDHCFEGGFIPDEYLDDVEFNLQVELNIVSSNTGTYSMIHTLTLYWMSASPIDCKLELVKTFQSYTDADYVPTGANTLSLTKNSPFTGRISPPGSGNWTLSSAIYTAEGAGTANTSILNCRVTGVLKYTDSNPASLKYQNVTLIEGYSGALTVATHSMVAVTPNVGTSELLQNSVMYPAETWASNQLSAFMHLLFSGTWGAVFDGKSSENFELVLKNPEKAISIVPEMTPDEYAESPFNGMVAPRYSASSLKTAWDTVRRVGGVAAKAALPHLIHSTLRELGLYKAGTRRLGGSSLTYRGSNCKEDIKYTDDDRGCLDERKAKVVYRASGVAKKKETCWVEVEKTEDSQVELKEEKKSFPSPRAVEPRKRKTYRASNHWDEKVEIDLDVVRPSPRTHCCVVLSPLEGSTASAHEHYSENLGDTECCVVPRVPLSATRKTRLYKASAEDFDLSEVLGEDEDDENEAPTPSPFQDDQNEDEDEEEEEEKEKEVPQQGSFEEKEEKTVEPVSEVEYAIPEWDKYRITNKAKPKVRGFPLSRPETDESKFLSNRGYIRSEVTIGAGSEPYGIYIPFDRDRAATWKPAKTFLDQGSTLSLQYFPLVASGGDDKKTMTTMMAVVCSILPVPQRVYTAIPVQGIMAHFDVAIQEPEAGVNVLKHFIDNKALVPFTSIYVSIMYAGNLTVSENSWTLALACAITYAPVGMYSGIFDGGSLLPVGDIFEKSGVANSLGLPFTYVGELSVQSPLQCPANNFQACVYSAQIMVNKAYTTGPHDTAFVRIAASRKSVADMEGYQASLRKLFKVADDNSKKNIAFTNWMQYFDSIENYMISKFVPETREIKKQDGTKVIIETSKILLEAKAQQEKKKGKKKSEFVQIEMEKLLKRFPKMKIAVDYDQGMIKDITKNLAYVSGESNIMVNIAPKGEDAVEARKFGYDNGRGQFTPFDRSTSALLRGFPPKTKYTPDDVVNKMIKLKSLRPTWDIVVIPSEQREGKNSTLKLAFGLATRVEAKVINRNAVEKGEKAKNISVRNKVARAKIVPTINTIEF